MKRYIPLLCFVFALTSLPTLSAGNRGCVIKKLATRPLPQRIGSRLGYQPTSVGIRLSGEIAELTEQLEAMNLAMQEKELQQEKYANEIEQLKQSLAAEKKFNKTLIERGLIAQKAIRAEARAKQAAQTAKNILSGNFKELQSRFRAQKADLDKVAAAKAVIEKNVKAMSGKMSAIQTELATSRQNAQKQLQESQQQLNASQDQVKALQADLANLKQAEQQRQKDEEKKRSQQKAVESTEGKDETEVTDDNPAPKDPESPAEKADDQAAIKEPETDAEGSAK